MASRIGGDSNQPVVDQASWEAARVRPLRSLEPEAALAAHGQAPHAAAHDVDPDESDLVAHALAILEREQERWRSSVSQNLTPGSRL
jgi:hypothetical protein